MAVNAAEQQAQDKFLQILLEVNKIHNELTSGGVYQYDRGVELVNILTGLREDNKSLDKDVEVIALNYLKELRKLQICGGGDILLGVMSPLVLPYAGCILYGICCKYQRCKEDIIRIRNFIYDIQALDDRMMNYVEILANREMKMRIAQVGMEDESGDNEILIAVDLIDMLINSNLEFTIDIPQRIIDIMIQILQEDLGVTSDDLMELISIGRERIKQENSKRSCLM